MEEKILLIGKLIQEGIEGEAEALKDYNRELAEIYALDAERATNALLSLRKSYPTNSSRR